MPATLVLRWLRQEKHKFKAILSKTLSQNKSRIKQHYNKEYTTFSFLETRRNTPSMLVLHDNSHTGLNHATLLYPQSFLA